MKTFLSSVDKHLLSDCPVTRDDIIVASERIFGPDVGSLKGKKNTQGISTSKARVHKRTCDDYVMVSIGGGRGRQYIVREQPALFRHNLETYPTFYSRVLMNKNADTIFKAIKHVCQAWNQAQNPHDGW
jgi:hypothetical protein